MGAPVWRTPPAERRSSGDGGSRVLQGGWCQQCEAAGTRPWLCLSYKCSHPVTGRLHNTTTVKAPWQSVRSMNCVTPPLCPPEDLLSSFPGSFSSLRPNLLNRTSKDAMFLNSTNINLWNLCSFVHSFIDEKPTVAEPQRQQTTTGTHPGCKFMDWGRNLNTQPDLFIFPT